MGGSAKYRYFKKLDKLQQKYGVGYANNPDYQRELTEIRKKWIEQQQKENERKAQKKAEKEAQKKEEVKNNPFSRDAYSKQRKDSALRATAEEYDNIHLPLAGKLWQESTKESQEAIYEYTGSACWTINSMLGGKEQMDDRNRKRINLMTDMIDKSELPQDTWLRRGVKPSSAARLFGTSITIDNIQKLIDEKKTFIAKEFMSCGSTETSGFMQRINYRIYCPKGTKAMYVDPFSANGSNYDRGGKWNGIDRTTNLDTEGELETIIQQGSVIRPTAIYETSPGKYTIEMEIVAQNPVRF